MTSSSLQEIVCCMGLPVAGNPTQYMMEKAFAAAGLDWRYLTLEVHPDQLGDAIRGIKAMGFRGANLTIPYKVAVIEWLDELSEGARLMGAVNCIHHVRGKLIGENTDGKGFLQALAEVTSAEGKRIEILGAGGAARAIAVELALAGAGHIDVVNRTAERGEALVRMIQAVRGESFPTRYIEWNGKHGVDPQTQILVQATSIGLSDAKALAPIELDSLDDRLVVADVIFNPAQTQLLQRARRRGCTTLDGLGMLVHQAVISFRIWTGIDPDAQIMREALEEFLGF